MELKLRFPGELNSQIKLIGNMLVVSISADGKLFVSSEGGDLTFGEEETLKFLARSGDDKKPPAMKEVAQIVQEIANG